MAETPAGKYEVLKNNLRQEYLNGLTAAAQALRVAFNSEKFFTAYQNDQNIAPLEEIFKKIIAHRGYTPVPKKQTLKSYWQRQAAKNTLITRKFKLDELKTLGRSLGYLRPDKNYWHAELITAQARPAYLEAPRTHQFITTGDGSKAAALAECQTYDPSIIISPAGHNLYTIEENHLPEEFLKGFVRGFQVIQAIFNSGVEKNYPAALKITLQTLKEMVNDARAEIGYPRIKNLPLYYENNIMKWRKRQQNTGWQNSR